MKKYFLFKIINLICITIFMIGCQSDTITENSIEDGIQQNTKRGFSTIDAPNASTETITILIKFKESIGENEKTEIRKKYIKKGLLLSWEACGTKDHYNYEVWTVDNDKYNVIRTAPLHHSDDDELERLIEMENADCNNVK